MNYKQTMNPMNIEPQLKSLPARKRPRLTTPLLAALLVLAHPATAATPGDATIWNGPRITFTKGAGADPTLAANQDRITANVWITQGSAQGIYNAKTETVYSPGISPADTEWAYGSTADTNLTFQPWETWYGGRGTIVDQNAVLHLKTDNIYIDIKFTSWGVGGANGGGFSYQRANGPTPNAPPSVAQDDALSGTFTDTRDNEVYKWLKIGDQVWMAENLRATKYADGTDIPLVNTDSAWDSLTATSKAYCWYNDDIANKDTHGALYTWAAAMNGAASVTANPSGVQGVSPTGWHLPSDAEWTQMVNYLADNGYNYDGTTGGGIAKLAKAVAASSSWNNAATPGGVGNTDYPEYRNKSGFTGLSSGFRHFNGKSLFMGKDADWWSATENNASKAWVHGLDFGTRPVYRGNHEKEHGFSVRCVRD